MYMFFIIFPYNLSKSLCYSSCLVSFQLDILFLFYCINLFWSYYISAQWSQYHLVDLSSFQHCYFCSHVFLPCVTLIDLTVAPQLGLDNYMPTMRFGCLVLLEVLFRCLEPKIYSAALKANIRVQYRVYLFIYILIWGWINFYMLNGFSVTIPSTSATSIKRKQTIVGVDHRPDVHFEVERRSQLVYLVVDWGSFCQNRWFFSGPLRSYWTL